MGIVRIGIGLLLGIVMATLTSGHVSAVDCKDVHILLTRGSGQSVGVAGGNAIHTFKTQLARHLDDVNISYTVREVSAVEYPAVSVSESIGGYRRAAGAWVSGGQSFAYGKSVKRGVGSLKAGIKAMYNECPKTAIVVAGYSQGAQVAGETVVSLKDEAALKQVAFVALFGDPRLNLPEGRRTIIDRGKYLPPPACRGVGFSQWRRDPIHCNTHAGSLGRRVPYLPDSMKEKVGLWCNHGDWICGSRGKVKDKNEDPHGSYGLPGAAAEKAAIESVTKILPYLSKEKIKTIETKRIGRRVKNNNIDIAFVLDTSGSMQSQIEGAKRFIRQSAEKIKALNGRVALTVFRNHCDNPPASVLVALTKDLDKIHKALESQEADGGCEPGEGSYHALKLTLDTLHWQQGATKAAILITDEPPADPDHTDQSTARTVAKRALEIDPVNIYPIVSGGNERHFSELANLTSGQVIRDTDTHQALDVVFEKLKTRPIPNLPLDTYKAMVGDEVRFDVADTYVDEGVTIKTYEWDFDGDGTIDHTTDRPVVAHRYGRAFDGHMSVRVIASNDTVASASAAVKIYTSPDELPALPSAPLQLNAVATSSTEAKLSWQAGEVAPDEWHVYMNNDLFAIVPHEAKPLHLIIGDITQSESLKFSVVGVKSGTLEGEPASVEFVPAKKSPQPPVAETCPYHYKIGRLYVYCQYKTVQLGHMRWRIVLWRVQPLP